VIFAIVIAVVLLVAVVYGLLHSPPECTCRIVNGHPFVYDRAGCPVHGDNSNSATQ
jgi:hypothetical protein